MPKVTATLIVRNEAAHVEAALDSVRWADEILVIDSESTDGTPDLARRVTDRVYVRPWPGYSAQKNLAAELASNDWILSLDADERVTPALADEIRTTLSSEPKARGFRMPRVTRHLGRWIRSTDWYPDYQLRLYDRRTGRWNGRAVHESVAVSGPVARLHAELEHHAYRDLAHHLETIQRYTTLSAEELHAAGRRVSALALLAHPPLAFLRNYVLRGGVRDGAPGLVISVMNSYYVFLKHAKLWELQRRRRRPPA